MPTPPQRAEEPRPRAAGQMPPQPVPNQPVPLQQPPPQQPAPRQQPPTDHPSVTADPHHRAPWTRPDPDEEPPPTPSELVDPPPVRGGVSRRHGDPLLVRTTRPVLRMLSRDTVPEDHLRAVEACQQPVTTGRRIGIISAVGGAGTTTLTACLALQFRSVRADEIAAVDLGGRGRGLAHRLPSTGGDDPGTGLAALASRMMTRAQVSRQEFHSFGTPLCEGLHRFAWGSPPRDPTTMSAAHQALSQWCAISVLELPSPEAVPIDGDEDHRSCWEGLHAVLVTTPAAQPGAEAAVELIGQLASSCPQTPLLTVMVDTVRARAAERRAAAGTLHAGLQSADLPPGSSQALHRLDDDAHLAGGRGIRTARVGEARRLQVARLAGAALSAGAQR